MKAIWKFPLDITERQYIEIPSGWHALSVQIQSGRANLWALVNVEADKRSVLVRCYGTGHSCPEDRGDYVGTVQQESGFVWHFFI